MDYLNIEINDKFGNNKSKITHCVIRIRDDTSTPHNFQL